MADVPIWAVSELERLEKIELEDHIVAGLERAAKAVSDLSHPLAATLMLTAALEIQRDEDPLGYLLDKLSGKQIERLVWGGLERMAKQRVTIKGPCFELGLIEYCELLPNKDIKLGPLRVLEHERGDAKRLTLCLAAASLPFGHDVVETMLPGFFEKEDADV